MMTAIHSDISTMGVCGGGGIGLTVMCAVCQCGHSKSEPVTVSFM